MIAVDWKKQEFFEEDEFCDEFLLLDLRNFANCVKVSFMLGGRGILCVSWYSCVCVYVCGLFVVHL